MKKLLLALGVVFALGLSAKAGTIYQVAVTTNIPTGSAGEYTSGSYPNVSSALFLDQLIIANEGATLQNVTVYDTCTSSAAATIGFRVVSVTSGTTVITFPNKTKLTKPCICKSSASSVIDATFIYR